MGHMPYHKWNRILSASIGPGKKISGCDDNVKIDLCYLAFNVARPAVFALMTFPGAPMVANAAWAVTNL